MPVFSSGHVSHHAPTIGPVDGYGIIGQHMWTKTPFRLSRVGQAVLAAGLCLSVVGGLFRLREGGVSRQDVAPESQVPMAETGDGPLVASKAAAEKARVSAPSNQWPALNLAQTEALHDVASAQLDRIAEVVRRNSPIDTAAIAGFVHESFVCQSLIPNKLHTVFQTNAITVLRGESHAGHYEGVSGFVKALNALKTSLHDAQQVRVKFKQFRLEPQNGFAATTDYVSISGFLGDRVIEQHMTWKCRWQLSVNGRPFLVSIESSDYEQVVCRGPSRTMFVEYTAAVLGEASTANEQLSHGTLHWIKRIEALNGVDFNGHHGLAIGDVNGDGLDDVYVCQSGGLPNLLLLHQADGTAISVAAQSDVDFLDSTTSALFVDLDNDGDQDLALATLRALIVMENKGDGEFTSKGDYRIAADATSISAADFDQDGKLDLYACRYYPQPDQRQAPAPLPYHDANNGPANVLLRNSGNWQFSDVTRSCGLDIHNRRWSFAAAWEDYDNDGDLDLYVANDFGRNCLYENREGQFNDVAARAGVEDVAAGMGVSWADYNHDGMMDLYVSNMFSAAGGRIAFQRRFNPSASSSTRKLIQRLARGNSLFQNLGDGTFRDVSHSSATTMGRWAWSSNFVDINNDGWQDLIVANGHITGEDDGDL